MRNAAARKDGYWPFISKKQTPPTEYTYGEFPLPFFSELIDRGVNLLPSLHNGQRSGAEFVDLGSGAGRLVLAAASMNPGWKRVRGVEFLPSLHSLAEEKLSEAKALPEFLTSPVVLEARSWDSPELDLSSVDIAFAYTTALPAEGGLLVSFTQALKSKLKKNTVVITTDYQLGDGFSLLSTIDGENPGTGGLSTGYIFLKEDEN